MKIVVFEAQPHYAGIFVAGTLYHHTQRGDEVHVISITDGERLTNIATPRDLHKINKQEMLAAADVLGITDVRFLGHHDCEIRDTHELRLELANILRELKPDLVLTHWPDNTFSDFNETGRAAINACFYALLVSGKWHERYDSHWTTKAYGFEHPGMCLGFKPTLFVDITDVIDVKLKAMDCFKMHIKCNFHDDPELWHSSVMEPNRYWAAQSGLAQGVSYAEPFAQLDIHEVHNKATRYLTA